MSATRLEVGIGLGDQRLVRTTALARRGRLSRIPVERLPQCIDEIGGPLEKGLDPFPRAFEPTDLCADLFDRTAITVELLAESDQIGLRPTERSSSGSHLVLALSAIAHRLRPTAGNRVRLDDVNLA